MNEFRRLATKIDQHMQQLATQGVSEAYVIINRMMGYVPDLHKIWVGASDTQLKALSHEFPGFYRYAILMEEAPKPNVTRYRGPMTAWPSSPKSTSNGLLNCWSRQQPLSAATRRFVEAATSKPSSPRSTSWDGCIGNGCPIWIASKTLYARRARNPRHWST